MPDLLACAFCIIDMATLYKIESTGNRGYAVLLYPSTICMIIVFHYRSLWSWSWQTQDHNPSRFHMMPMFTTYWRNHTVHIWQKQLILTSLGLDDPARQYTWTPGQLIPSWSTCVHWELKIMPGDLLTSMPQILIQQSSANPNVLNRVPGDHLAVQATNEYQCL